jgi:hypothetical protein
MGSADADPILFPYPFSSRVGTRVQKAIYNGNGEIAVFKDDIMLLLSVVLTVEVG